MSRSNARSISVSPPLENMTIDDVPDVKKWIGAATYFLEKDYSLEEIDNFNMFTFDYTDEQHEIVRNENGEKIKDVYNLDIRFWKMTINTMYYIRCATVEKSQLTVTFLRRWISSVRRDEFTLTFLLADSMLGLSNPFLQDHAPREDCITSFQRHKDRNGKPMTIAHIVKFFNACQYILIAHSCRMDKDPTASVSGLTDARLKRMTNIMLSTWDTYPTFAKRYAKNPIPIEDQQFSKMKNPENSFGSVIVLLTLNKCEEDYLPFIRTGEEGKKDLAEVRKMLANGEDPLPPLLSRIPVDERDYHVGVINSIKHLRW